MSALLAFRKTTHSIDMLCMQVQTPSEGSPPPTLKPLPGIWLVSIEVAHHGFQVQMREVWGEGRSFSCCSQLFCQINPDSVPNSVSKSHQLLRSHGLWAGGLCYVTVKKKSPEGSAGITHQSTPSNCLDAHMSPNLQFICDHRWTDLQWRSGDNLITCHFQ